MEKEEEGGGEKDWIAMQDKVDMGRAAVTYIAVHYTATKWNSLSNRVYAITRKKNLGLR